MPRQMERPSPVPTPGGLVVKKGSKIAPRISGGCRRRCRRWRRPPAPPRRRWSGRDADLVAGRVALAHRLRGVDQQVEEHLAEARRVGHRPRGPRRSRGPGGRGGGSRWRRSRCVESSTRRTSTGSRRSVSMRENDLRSWTMSAPARRPRAPRAGAAPISAPARRRPETSRISSIEVEEHVRERVVDLVRDAGCQRAQRGEPIGLDELGLGAAQRLLRLEALLGAGERLLGGLTRRASRPSSTAIEARTSSEAGSGGRGASGEQQEHAARLAPDPIGSAAKARTPSCSRRSSSRRMSRGALGRPAGWATSATKTGRPVAHTRPAWPSPLAAVVSRQRRSSSGVDHSSAHPSRSPPSTGGAEPGAAPGEPPTWNEPQPGVGAGAWPRPIRPSRRSTRARGARRRSRSWPR